MSDTTKKRLKFAGKLLFVCLLLGILYYSFRDSMGDMLTELANVSPQVVMSLFLTVILYHIFEGHITWLIVHKTHPEYPRLKGFCNAFYCSFYKTATLGSGSGIAGIYYLNKAGIPVPNATGMYFFQYIVHKVSMAVYSLLLFLATYGFIHASFADYQCYILLGFAGVCVIAGVLLAVATVPWMQTACNLLANRFRAKHPSWEEKLTGAGHKLALLQAESRSLLQDPILLLHLFLCNVLKFTIWYIIPWIVFCNSLGGEYGDLPFSFPAMFCSDLSQPVAGGCHPHPGGDRIRRSCLYIAVPASPAGGQSPVCRASLPFRHHAVTLCDRCVLCTGGEDYFSAQEKENGRLICFPKISTQNKPLHSILCRGSYYVPLL